MLILLVYLEGTSILSTTTEISCPDKIFNCEVEFKNGSILTLQPGEVHSMNKHDTPILPLINYGSLIMLIIIMLVNHFMYNRHFKFNKKVIERIIIKELRFWFSPIIYIVVKINKIIMKK